ncbi:hypothetical protein MMA231_02009 [Asticcacaulis sp. MM231]|uniref:hypothetical protein n=1 Tax=Asticcacaulis sp. MM231 TaxID=3157666 RepID=UPI0032D59FA7
MEQTDITARLHRLATELLDAYERIDAPSTYLEAERAARALIAIGKAVSAASGEPAPPKASSKEPGKEPAKAPACAEVKTDTPPKVVVPSPALTLERAAKALMRGDLETFEALMPQPPPV